MEVLKILVLFLEGIFSFFSPCVLPIIPVYLSILSNSSVEDLKSQRFIRSSLFKNTLFFVLGISITFFILGSSVKALSLFFKNNKDIIMLIGGIIIVIMGLFYMGIIKWGFLNREKRFNTKIRKINPLSAFILGFTFSFGWTPCIGPILASVLIMASNSSDFCSSNGLILVYTLGFIVPFILVSLFYNKLFATLDKVKKYMNKIKIIGGLILVISGAFMVVNAYSGTIEQIHIKNKTINQIEGNKEINNQEKSDSSINSQKNSEKIKPIDFTLYDQYGKEHKLSDYKGKVVFLNFWATWCPPCRREMPYIEQLYKEYNYNKDDVIILGVASPNIGEEGNEEYIKNFLKKNGYNFPVVFDKDGSMIFQYGVYAFPSTFIIDKEGYITQYVPGALNEDSMKKLIESAK